MSEPQSDPSAEDLLVEIAWTRRLAAGLLSDAAAVDDITQDTWLAATRHFGVGSAPARAWLRTVLVNLVRRRARDDSSRRARELEAARSEREPPATDCLLRFERQRMLVDLVNGLDEAHRTVVLMRFAAGLSPLEISRRLGVPGGTVRSRLKRALAKMREQLDRSHGGSDRWVPALIPLATSRVQRAGWWSAKSAAICAGFSAAGAVVIALGSTGPSETHREPVSNAPPRVSPPATPTIPSEPSNKTWRVALEAEPPGGTPLPQASDAASARSDVVSAYSSASSFTAEDTGAASPDSAGEDANPLPIRFDFDLGSKTRFVDRSDPDQARATVFRFRFGSSVPSSSEGN